MSQYKETMFKDLKVGDSASISMEVTDEDVRAFAKVSRDGNPIHVDEEFAKDSLFGKRIAHGMLGAGLISAVIGTKLPGVNTIYLGQNLSFRKPVFLGDTITATVEITELREDKKLVSLKTTVTNQDGKEVIVGDALVKKD